MFDLLTTVFGYRAAGIPVGRLALSLLVIAAALVIRRVLLSALRRAGRGRPGFAGAMARDLAGPAAFLVLVIGAYGAVGLHPLSRGMDDAAGKVFLFLLTVGVLWMLMRVVDAVAEQMASVADGTDSRMDDQLIPILRKLAKFILVAVGIVFYMQSNGYPVSGILAGMGIGGLALALAAQDSIAGIFASVVIFLDKPFMVEDFVEVNGVTGTVEEIGIRSTRIRTVEKTLVTLPNKEIMDSNINNFSRRPMRRTEARLGVTYDTTPDKMRELLARLREMLEGDDMVDDGTVFVNFSGFGDSSLDVDMRYFIKSADYRTWLDNRERINLGIMDIVHGLGLEFAFPSTTVYLQR